ncbi:MAG: hypothetical protein OES57_11385 [Acidimicrobiia bacterium]|nr:hypothetical protein [Acidimicrobiia bacterium]
MRPFAIWVLVVAAVFAALAIAAAVWPEDEPDQVFVVVDSSFPMRAVWDEVDDELARIEGRGSATFALATEKRVIHGFQSELRLGSVEAFAPCDFDEVLAYPQIAEADELILVTTDGSCDTAAFADWDIRTLE